VTTGTTYGPVKFQLRVPEVPKELPELERVPKVILSVAPVAVPSIKSLATRETSQKPGWYFMQWEYIMLFKCSGAVLVVEGHEGASGGGFPEEAARVRQVGRVRALQLGDLDLPPGS